MVLKSSGDDVLLALHGTEPGGGDDGLVVGLAAAGGENDLLGVAAQTGSDGGTGPVQCFLGPLTHRVQAGRVAVDFIKIGQHGGNGRLAHGRGGCVIGIYLHRNTSKCD